MGLSVSKKVGNAVVRNRSKRIMKEAFRASEYKEMGIDVLVIVSPFFYKKNTDKIEASSKLRKSFLHLLSQIKL